jgi:ABC-type transporter MlaC component
LFSSRDSADVDTSGACVVVRRFNDALIGTMMADKQTKFQARFTRLAPVVEEALNPPDVLVISLGPRWMGIAADQQNRLLDAFRRYIVASYSVEDQAFLVYRDDG